MMPISPDGTATAKDAVDGLRHAHREPLTSPDDSAMVVGFHEQVEVISLHAEM